MGNEIERAKNDDVDCDANSTAAILSGTRPSMTASSSAEDVNHNNAKSIYHNRTADSTTTGIESEGAVGPLFTMESSKDNGGEQLLSSGFQLPPFLQPGRSASPPTTMYSPSSPSAWTTTTTTNENNHTSPFSNLIMSGTKSPTKLSATRSVPYSPTYNSNKSLNQPAVNVGSELEIEEGTPADKALKANAQVKVNKVSKAARYINAQSIKKLWNRNFGYKKGKPPRVPDVTRRWSDNDLDIGSLKNLDEGNEEYDEEDEEQKQEQEQLHEVEVVDVLDNELVGRALFSPELDHRDFTLVPKTGDEEEPDSTYVDYNSTRLDKHKIILHDKHGKKHEFRMFDKLKRSKDRRKEKRKSYVKGKVIEEEHELYTLSIAVMLGLRYAIYQTHRQLENDKRDKRFWLDSEEFMRMEKYVFRPDGRNNTPPHKLGHTFKFKDYSPVPFAYIRRMFGINEYEFIHSVCGNANFIEFISNAKSGQFFFYSNDGKYMIKTMTNTESKFLRRILPHYFRHCAQNPSTLITKFLGMYRVKLYHLRRNVKFIVMNSVFDTDKMISSFYDLKGSSIGRQAKQNESVKKDNDVRTMIQIDPNSAFILPQNVRARLRDQMVRDCEFLKEMKIMDYSMLIGVHYIPSKDSGTTDSIKGLVFRDSESFIAMSRKKQNQNISRKNQPSLGLVRSKSDGAASLMNHRNTSKNESPSNMDKKKASGKKVDFLLDKECLSTELLEEKPSHSNSLLTPPFNMTEIEKVIYSGDQSVMSTSTLGHEEEDEVSFPDSYRQMLPIRDDILLTPTTSNNSVIDWERERLGVDIRREMAIEQSYWPFHRYYEINGQRRVIPINKMYRLSDSTGDGDGDIPNVECSNCLGDSSKFDPDLSASRKKWQLSDFEKPISNRKDCGFLMDVTGIQLPMTVKAGKHTQLCDGKIFYMGIIDVLQQFNVRKRMEAKYRRMKGAGWDKASCVAPQIYAERFIQFFDEYTSRGNSGTTESPNNGEEEILFH